MEADRISLLPDDLLHHILSFIDNTQMVIKSTCILSKRWKNVWTSIPTLILDYASFSCHHLNRKRCFCLFIKRIILRRTPLAMVKKINFCFSTEPLRHGGTISRSLLRFREQEKLLLKQVFHFAARNHVQELCINGARMDISTCRFDSFLTCRSLKLSGYLSGKWLPPTLKFLNSLEIENYYCPSVCLKLKDDMFPTCPLLERLVLRGSCFARANITAPKLQHLEIAHFERWFIPEIFLSTPKLASLKLYNVVPTWISVNYDYLSPHEVEFSLTFNNVSTSPDNQTKQQVVERLRRLFHLLQKANSLAFNSVALEVLSEFIVPSPVIKDEAVKFQKLRDLRLKGSITLPSPMLCRLLNSPSLKTWQILW